MEARRKPRISLDLLQTFRAAARHLNFTRASVELSVTQSAISHGIRALEEQLGVPLFRRFNRALELTFAGELLFRAVEDALAVVEAAAERVVGTANTLAITTTTALASLWLVPRLAQFAQAHAAIDLRIAASNDWIDLEREDLDIAIRYVPRAMEGHVGERLCDYETFPVCAPALLREASHPLGSPADLAGHARLDFETVVYGRPWFDWVQWFKAHDLPQVRPVRTHLFSHYDQVIQAAVDGMGVAIGKMPHLARHLRDGVLVAPFGRDCVARPGHFVIAIADAARERSDVAAFVTWLKGASVEDAKQALPGPAGAGRPGVRQRDPDGGAA